MRYGFVIDKQRCIGCHTCSVACKIENNIRMMFGGTAFSPKVGTRWTFPLEIFPTPPSLIFRSTASTARILRASRCVPSGRRTRIWRRVSFARITTNASGAACAWLLAPTRECARLTGRSLAIRLAWTLDPRTLPSTKKHTVEKCTMCWHRVAEGEEPACIVACRAVLASGGDFDDPSSEVSTLIRGREHAQLLSEEGTNPSVYYLI